MVSLKLITFVTLLILLLVSQGAMSKVLAADGTDKIVAPRRSPPNVEKENYDGVPAAVAEVEETRIGGRKMIMIIMPKRILGMVKDEGFDNIHGERRLRNTSGRRRHVKVKIADFIPLNADYHVPKPHPPKNN